MPITHQFVSVISDDAGDVAAGKVVPSNWNASHTVALVTSELPGAVLIQLQANLGGF